MIKKVKILGVLLFFTCCSERQKVDCPDTKINYFSGKWELDSHCSPEVKIKDGTGVEFYSLPEQMSIHARIMPDSMGVYEIRIPELVGAGRFNLSPVENNYLGSTSIHQVLFRERSGGYSIELSMITDWDGLQAVWEHIATYRKIGMNRGHKNKSLSP